MHPSAVDYGSRFFSTYCKEQSGITIVDIGSQDVNGSLRDVAPSGIKYIGVDFCQGKGVDVLLTDPYVLPFGDASVDVVVCSSVFEHSEFFWLLFLEVMRILKPDGLFYLNAPSNGFVHRYPVDCWRFYPDSGLALVAWGKKNGYAPALLESFIGEKYGDVITEDMRNEYLWNDTVAVFVKNEEFKGKYLDRIVLSLDAYSNGRFDNPEIPTNEQFFTEDFLLLNKQRDELCVLRESLKERYEREAEAFKERYEREAEAFKVLYEREVEALSCIVSERDNQIDSLSHEISVLVNSRSWRLTTGLRSLGYSARGLRNRIRLIVSFARSNGGFLRVLSKSVSVLRKDGFSGLKQKADCVGPVAHGA